MNQKKLVSAILFSLILLVSSSFASMTCEGNCLISNPALETNVPRILVVSNFSEIQVQVLAPLSDQWALEGISFEFVDVNVSWSHDGRDGAEKLRNYLQSRYQAAPFAYLFFIDIVYPDMTHVVPARVFAPSWSDIPGWNDYYYANLYGNFDVNANGIYGENLTDMNDVTEYQTVVGRLVLDSQDYMQELQNYVNADIAYRSEEVSMMSSFILYRDYEYQGETDGWSRPFVENLTSLIRDLGYGMYTQVYNYSSYFDVAQALTQCNFAMFYGHGSTYSQQIGWFEGGADYYGPYISTDDFRNFGTLTANEPSAMFFGGCNTGQAYDLLFPDFARIPVAVAPMIYLETPAVMVVANTGLGAHFGKTDYEILQSATTEPLSKAVLDQHVKEMQDLSIYNNGFPYYKLGTFTYGYFGDPTLRLHAALTLVTDLNQDGTVNILDVTMVAAAYNTKPGDLKWNELADLDSNEWINILDISAVAKDYGKTV